MTERTLVERLRAIAEPRFSPLFPEEVTTLREAAAALEWLRKELENIANANPRIWPEETRDQFQQWAQSRARAALNHAAPAAHTETD